MLTRFSSSVLALGSFSAMVQPAQHMLKIRISAAFEPVFPTIDLAADNSDKSGAIYQQGQSGLFSSDRRARKVGDILTVDFNEVFAATKAQSAASSKSDLFELGFNNCNPKYTYWWPCERCWRKRAWAFSSESTAQSFSGSA